MAEPIHDTPLPVDRTLPEQRILAFRIRRRIGYLDAAWLDRLSRLTSAHNHQFVVERLHQNVYRDGFA